VAILDLAAFAEKSVSLVEQQDGSTLLRGIEDAPHQLVLLGAYGFVCGEHIVEVGEVRQADARGLHGPSDARGARRTEGLAQIEGVGHRIEKRRGRHIALRGMQGRRELDIRATELPGELQPLLDGQIRVGVPQVARSQFL